jgi:hypothetical protein
MVNFTKTVYIYRRSNMEQLGENKERRVFHKLSLIFKTDNANIGLDAVRHGDIVSFVEGYQRFGGNCCLHLQGSRALF